MKILILGSKGFIGNYCFNYFNSKKDFSIWGADVVTDYVSERYFKIDSSNSDFNEIFELHQFDFCINCSGAASVPDSLVHPKKDYLLNTYNVFNLLEAIRLKNSNCKLIQLSSAAVYGTPDTLPVKETCPANPLSPYGMHKKMAEELCSEYYKFYNIQSVVLRIFSAYGPELKKQLFWDVAFKSSKEKNLALFGTGSESRDFIFIDDIVQAMEVILCKNKMFEAQPINIASGKETTIKEAVDILLKHLDWNGNYNFSGETRKGDPINWKADISFLNSLNFKPKTNIESGLKQYADWFVKRI